MYAQTKTPNYTHSQSRVHTLKHTPNKICTAAILFHTPTTATTTTNAITLYYYTIFWNTQKLLFFSLVLFFCFVAACTYSHTFQMSAMLKCANAFIGFFFFFVVSFFDVPNKFSLDSRELKQLCVNEYLFALLFLLSTSSISGVFVVRWKLDFGSGTTHN